MRINVYFNEASGGLYVPKAVHMGQEPRTRGHHRHCHRCHRNSHRQSPPLPSPKSLEIWFIWPRSSKIKYISATTAPLMPLPSHKYKRRSDFWGYKDAGDHGLQFLRPRACAWDSKLEPLFCWKRGRWKKKLQKEQESDDNITSEDRGETRETRYSHGTCTTVISRGDMKIKTNTANKNIGRKGKREK